MKKSTMALTTALLFAAVLTACGDAAVTTPADTQVQETTVAEETEEVTERVTANLPEKDFGGETITFYARLYDNVWSEDSLVVHEQNGEQINDASYERTSYIEDTYNVKLDVIRSEDATVLSKVKSIITAGDDEFQALVSDVYDAASLSVEGMLLDLNDVENIDLTAEWWSQKGNKTLTIANRQFYAMGDLLLVDNKATRVFFFNKDIVRDLDMTSPYTYVANNEWTFETFFTMCDEALADLNGDNQYNRGDDRYGSMSQETLGEVLLLAAGESMTKKDENDIPYISCTSDRALMVLSDVTDRCAKSISVSQSGDSLLNLLYPDNLGYFTYGQALFAPEVLVHIESMRDCTIDIGIVPPPKYDEAQEGYYCFADGWCVNVVSIPVTNSNSADTGFILEAMSADALNNITPAYYDVCLRNKYVRDEESAQMLDLIFENVVMDNANIFSWGSLETKLNAAVKKGTSIASDLEKVRSATEKAINKTVTAIEELE